MQIAQKNMILRCGKKREVRQQLGSPALALALCVEAGTNRFIFSSKTVQCSTQPVSKKFIETEVKCTQGQPLSMGTQAQSVKAIYFNC